MQALKRQELREAQPLLVQAVHDYATKGYSIPAITRATSLSQGTILDLTSDRLPSDMETTIRESGKVKGLPDRPLSYEDVRQLKERVRVDSNAVQVDLATTVRAKLLRRMDSLLSMGNVNMAQATRALQVIGVPKAPDYDQSPATAKAGAPPPEYIYDDKGVLTANPDYASWVNKSTTAAPAAGTTINIGMDVIQYLRDKADNNLQTDDAGRVISMQDGGQVRTLQSMSPDNVHKMAYGTVDSTDVSDNDEELTDLLTQVVEDAQHDA